MRLILDLGFKLKISLCFNSCDSVPLPAWVREAGRQNPDIWYTDRQGFRSQESLTLGIDHGERPGKAAALLPSTWLSSDVLSQMIDVCPVYLQYLSLEAVQQ
jgi:hypothetical protein